MNLILFDIDGTLIHSHRAGRRALSATLETLFGTAGPIEAYNMSGKTDQQIITDLLAAIGLQSKEIAAKLPDVYRLFTEKARAIFPQNEMSPCPGVETLLATLNGQSNVLLGLLTGNIATTAPLKLSAAGIEPSQFRVGAYGSDAPDRNLLPAIAKERAGAYSGNHFGGENTIIIGDTPADIMCARAGGATAVAVATGWYSAQTLSSYQPDHLFENFSNNSAVLDILLRA